MKTLNMMQNDKYDSLDSLNDTKYEWRIKVRVIRIWDSYSSKGDREFKGRNMLLLDDKNNRMHAFIWPNYADEFKNTFKEGNVYSIRNFAVKKYRKESLRCTRYDKQIWLSNYTKVSKIEDDHKTDKMIRNMEFDFFDIGDIPDMIKQGGNNYLIDVVGVLKDRDVLRHFTNQKEIEQRSVRFTITDGSAYIKICFWDDLAESFASEIDKVLETPIVIIVAGCKHNEYKGEPYVSNVGATRFYINYNHRSVVQLKQRASSPDFFQYTIQRKETDRVQIMTVAGIRALNSSFFMKTVMCQVTIKTVKETKDWNYDACSSCQKEIELINGKFRCEECKRTIPFPDKRFRLCFIAEDATGSVAFIIDNREVESILGKTVYDVNPERDGEGKIETFPKLLKTLEGNKYTISVCLTEENVIKGSNTYYVVDIYEGFEIVQNMADDDDDFSGVYKTSQYSSSYSIQNDTLKTPDTEKSTNSNRLKRMNEKAVISITNLDDENDEEAVETKAKKQVQPKQIKKEKD